MAKPPSRKSSSGEVARFLEKSRAISQFVDRQPRLLFAIDATASRQPTWDTASHLQQEMFRATAEVASLSVQLCYYRGFAELKAKWRQSRTAGEILEGRFPERVLTKAVQRMLPGGPLSRKQMTNLRQ